MPFVTLIILIILHVACPADAAAPPPFAVATEATPVFNTPDIPRALTTRDSCGLLRAVEFVALPGTVFTVSDELHQGGRTVYRVSSDDYPYPTTKGYYLDSRTVRPETAQPAKRPRSLPDKGAIIAAMKKRLGTGYVWGGNVAEGVRDRWGSGSDPVLAGLDCSGLLYEATGGYTPRNTSALAHYGTGVAIAGKGAQRLARELRPLDLIVWPGHVLIVVDGGNVIESRLVCGNPREGVRVRPLQAALAEVMGKRRPADSIGDGAREFVVRRWYGERS